MQNAKLLFQIASKIGDNEIIFVQGEVTKAQHSMPM